MTCVGQANAAKALIAAHAAVSVFPNVTLNTPDGPQSLRDIMVAIAGQESAYDPGATNGIYIGLWQIGNNHEGVRTFFHVPPQDFTAWLKIPRNNALAARHLMAQRGKAWNVRLSAWSTWQSGAYRACLPFARMVVATAHRQIAAAAKRAPRKHSPRRPIARSTVVAGTIGAAAVGLLVAVLI